MHVSETLSVEEERARATASRLEQPYSQLWIQSSKPLPSRFCNTQPRKFSSHHGIKPPATASQDPTYLPLPTLGLNPTSPAITPTG